jgi:hypothetical protein
LPIADFQLPIFQSPRSSIKIGNRQLEIGNVQKTPKRGQSAQCPDRLLRTKAADLFRQIFWE